MQVSFHFTATENVVIPAVVGRPLLIFKVEIHAGLGVNVVTFRRGLIPIYGPVEIERRQSFKIGDNSGEPVMQTQAGEPLVISQTANRTLSGTINFSQG